MSTRSITREHFYKIDRPAGRRLVTSQPKASNRYNKIIEEQFKIYRIEKHMSAVDNFTIIYGRPGPIWLRSMIIKLYKKMDEVIIHGKKECRKMMNPISDFSP